MSEKVHKIAEEDVKRIQSLARDGARSGAYVYPVKVRNTVIENKQDSILQS